MPAPSAPIDAAVRQDKAAGVLLGSLPAIGWYFGKWCHQMQTLLDVRETIAQDTWDPPSVREAL